MMSGDRVELNKLKVRREFLFGELKREYDKEGGLHFDVMVLVNLHCEHQCGIESKFSARATEIAELDQRIEELQQEVFLPKWRAAHVIMKTLMQSGRIKTDGQFEKAARFFTLVEEKLAKDEVHQAEEKEQPEIKSNKRFLVALSFPGEHREFVAKVAGRLSQELGQLRVLYDKFHEAEFARPNLDTHLQALYHDESELVVVFLCADYERKEWPGLEWRAIRDLIKKKQASSIMLIRLDDANVSGVFSIDGYISAEGRTPTDIATLIIDRLRILETERQSPGPSQGSAQPATPAREESASTISPELSEKIERAREARRRHDYSQARQLWDQIGSSAEQLNDCKTSIRARLEKAYLQLEDDSDPDEALKTIEACLNESKNVDLGKQRARVLQLLGETHRIKGNTDQARGFLNGARDYGRSTGDKCDEGWALLALAVLEKGRGNDADGGSGLDLIQQAYDCFSALYVSGDQEKQRWAREGFAACHSWRAEVFDHVRLDDAMVEYARALEFFREMGSEYEWNVADILFRRGDLHARADDPQLAAKDLIAAAELFKKLGDCLMEAKCVLGIAELLDHRGQRLESKQYYEAAAAITMQQKDRKKAAWIWFRYACKLFELREYEQGKSIFMTLLAADWIRPGQRLDVLRMLCLVAKATGQQEELELHSKATLDIIDEQIAKVTSADERRRLIISKGQSLEELDEHERAIACFRRGIEAFEAVNDRHGIIECWSHIAQVMGKTKKRKEEREAYEKVLSLIGEKGDPFHLPMTLTMLAQLDIFEQRFDEARKHLDRAEQENEKLVNPAVFMIVQDLRSKLPPT